MAIVIKYGGNAMTDLATRSGMAKAIAKLKDQEPIVIHGGGPFIQEALDRAQLAHRFIEGLRVTTAESLVIIERVLTLLGKELAQEIGDAVALTGRDAAVLKARLKDEKLGLVGTVYSVNTHLLRALLKNQITPVLACLAANETATAVLNVNADEAAAAVAAALGLGVVFLTNVLGVLDDPDDPGSLQTELSQADILARIQDGRISGGMIPKVQGALAALKQGAPYAIIADGRYPDRLELSLRGEAGTRVFQ